MKFVIQYVFMGIFTLAFCQENTWRKPSAWHSIFQQMEFRTPVTLTPYEIKSGFIYSSGYLNWTTLVANSLGENDSLKTNKSPIVYLHPYELGGNYPRKLKMSTYRRFRHTFNIKNVPEKTAEIVQGFNSISIKTFLKNRGYFD